MERFALIATTAALLAFAQPASAITVKGLGAATCTQWSIHHPANGNSPNDLITIGQESWVLGFLSAVNSFAPQIHHDIVKSADADALYAWITQWCSTRPLDVIGEGAAALALELERRLTK